MEDLSNILIFKTNVRSDEDLKRMEAFMQSEGLSEWNVDREDIDCVLRVDTLIYSEKELMELVRLNGFICEELE